MNTRFIVQSMAVLALFCAGCVTDEKYGAFVPKGELAPSNAKAYADYGSGMAQHEGFQMAYTWQRNNNDAVKNATKLEVIAKFVSSDAAADALLAKIGTSYDGDPIALTQIAAVTQLVMTPKCAKAAECRKLWVSALERARAATDDGYVKTFCDQQLRLCKPVCCE